MEKYFGKHWDKNKYVKRGVQKVNINSSISSNGFSGSFKYKYGSVILIRLEDAQYNDEYISTDISTKIKNY